MVSQVRPKLVLVDGKLTDGLDCIHSARLPMLLPREYQPQPIILDSYLRTPPSCRLIRNYLNKLQPIPIVVGSKKLLEEMPYLDAELDEAGAEVATCAVDGVGRISLSHVLDEVVVGESVMVEGGASVINSFLTSGLVDQVIVTTAPITVGKGVSVEPLGVSCHSPVATHLTRFV